MRRIFDDNDLNKVHKQGTGLVYNDFSGRGRDGDKYNVLHTAGCFWVPKSNTNVPKYYFDSLREATEWLSANRGPEKRNWKRCGTCRAEAIPPLPQPSLPPPPVTDHPWQHGPTELISYAISHMHRDTDFDRRLVFLHLDIGVETLFQTYLVLPAEVTGTTMSYGERKKAAEGNFHELVRGVAIAAGKKLQGYNLAHILFYHNTRNKLYHQGNGITVPMEQVQGYARLAVGLLYALLEVELSELLGTPAKPEP